LTGASAQYCDAPANPNDADSSVTSAPLMHGEATDEFPLIGAFVDPLKDAPKEKAPPKN